MSPNDKYEYVSNEPAVNEALRELAQRISCHEAKTQEYVYFAEFDELKDEVKDLKAKVSKLEEWIQSHIIYHVGGEERLKWEL